LTTEHAREFRSVGSGLRFREVVVRRTAVIKFLADDRSGNSTDCFGIEARADTTKLMNMNIYTPWAIKKRATYIFPITLANIDGFS